MVRNTNLCHRRLERVAAFDLNRLSSLSVEDLFVHIYKIQLHLECSLWSSGAWPFGKAVECHGKKMPNSTQKSTKDDQSLSAMSSRSRANSNASFTVQRISPIRDMTLCCLQLVKYEDVAHWPASSVFTVRKRSISTNCKASFKAEMVEIESALVKSSSVSFRQFSIWLRCLWSSAASGMSSSSPRTSETKFTVDFTKVWAWHSRVHWHLKMFEPFSRADYSLWDQFSPKPSENAMFLVYIVLLEHVTHRPLLPTPDPNPSQILEQWETKLCNLLACGWQKLWDARIKIYLVFTLDCLIMAYLRDTASVFSCFLVSSFLLHDLQISWQG